MIQVIGRQAAAKSEVVEVPADKVPSTFYVDGSLSGTEKIVLQQENSDGTFQPIRDGGSDVVLDIDNTHTAIYAPGTIKFAKELTTNNVGLRWSF